MEGFENNYQRPRLGDRPQGGGFQKWERNKPEGDNKDRLFPDKFLSQLSFNNRWITEGADKDMNDFAEKSGEYMAPKDERDKDKLSKSQIRNVYGEIKRIQLKGINSAEGQSSFVLLKAKVAYAEGRNKTKGLTLFKLIFNKGWEVVTNNGYDSKMYNNFCNLLEAILAYHKAYGGKD
ncbi:MAG: type III-A CRISPR-associated protein Csm2 [Paludibacteraceae bacterium]|nr:type III-A CRISPR-associated protein Csm2 [Paludibacteraceae bacterium]